MFTAKRDYYTGSLFFADAIFCDEPDLELMWLHYVPGSSQLFLSGTRLAGSSNAQWFLFRQPAVHSVSHSPFCRTVLTSSRKHSANAARKNKKATSFAAETHEYFLEFQTSASSPAQHAAMSTNSKFIEALPHNYPS